MNIKKIIPSLISNKKGEKTMGLNVAISFFLAFAVLVIIGFIYVIVLGNLLGDGSILNDYSDEIITEESDAVDEFGVNLGAVGNASYYLPVCTIGEVVNKSSNVTLGFIGTTNYTTSNSGCTITPVATAEYNGSEWHFNYTVSYKDPNTAGIITNSTGAISDFFTNAGTWLTLLSVVIILLIVTIVIVTVRRFGSGKNVGGGGGSTEGTSGGSGDFAKL